MQRCLITYLPMEDETSLYSRQGLYKLSPRLTHLKPFPYSAEAQRHEAAARATKLSIQGVQPKLSAKLTVADNSFTIVDKGGTYIIKPQHFLYPDLPQNEDLTMHLAHHCGIQVPLHGLLYCDDGSLSYFIKRFDRRGVSDKVHLEDFSQLAGLGRDAKYNSSMEQVAKLIQTFCTFPVVEKQKLFLRLLFCFMVGNEDMHLKNFSLIRTNQKVELSPAYDLLNTTMVLPEGHEELALPIRGKKNKLKKEDFLTYYGREILDLPERVILNTLKNLQKKLTESLPLIDISFLTESHKEVYRKMVEERLARFQ